MKKIRLNFDQLHQDLEVLPAESLSKIKGGLSASEFIDSIITNGVANIRAGSYLFENDVFMGLDPTSAFQLPYRKWSLRRLH